MIQWNNNIIRIYLLYTLPHGTPTWDNFRGDETRNDMNPVSLSIMVYPLISSCVSNGHNATFIIAQHHHESSPTMFNSHASPPVIRSHLLSSTMMTKTIKACSENNRFHQVSFFQQIQCTVHILSVDGWTSPFALFHPTGEKWESTSSINFWSRPSSTACDANRGCRVVE